MKKKSTLLYVKYKSRKGNAFVIPCNEKIMGNLQKNEDPSDVNTPLDGNTYPR